MSTNYLYGINIENIQCIKQQGLTCAFHAIANAKKLRATNGQSVINLYESQILEAEKSVLENYMHSLGICAGKQELDEFERNGGIVLLDPVTSGCANNSKFVQAINYIIKGHYIGVAMVVMFKVHTVALYITKDANNKLKIKYADSDGPTNSTHPDTFAAVSTIARYCAIISYS